MKNIFKYVRQLFDAPANMTGTDNIDTEVRLIDFVTSFQKNIQALLDILGISRLIRKENGTEMKVKKVSGVLQSGDVAEGDEIPASEYKVQERRLGKIKLKKYKKTVSIEAIADKGYDVAVADTDTEMQSNIRDAVMNSFYEALKMGALCGSKTTFQAAIAHAIGLCKDKFKKMHKTATGIAVWVNTMDLYDYLGNATVTIQTAFGFEYIKNFMGAEIVFISSEIEPGKVYATPVNNIVVYYVNPGDSEFTRAGLNYYVDGTTGMIGFYANGNYDRAVSNAYAITGIRMMCEYIDAIANVDIQADAGITLNVVPVTNTSVDLLGKTCADLQDGVKVENGLISGKLKFVDDYTGYSGAPAEQVGHYLALYTTSDDGAVITMTMIGGKNDGRTVTLDDGYTISKIENEFCQKLKFVATKGGKTTTRTFGLTGLWLEDEDD